MSTDLESKRAIEEIKLRTPIEEVVRERLPELRKRGRLWEACCPFHEERTASFKVDPARGTWRCYGACQVGGDVIAFVQRSQNLAFPEALELLAARAGVELPRRRGRGEPADGDPGLAALAAADAFFQAELAGSGGRAAREYLRQRGVTDNTIQAFGLGWAPRSGSALVAVAQRVLGDRHASGDSAAMDAWERTSLLRRSDDGRLYSFFRGRITIPIRDLKGRTVGFGARRLESGDAAGPKYIN
ncbi:MAG: CHC2 zinc finger domain-containing protein, partial [Planctomycetota bacterium]